jgi:lysine-N-methylase
MDPKPFATPALLPALPIFPPATPEGLREQHLRPDYAKGFACIASACEDTCCRGWSVPIDQVTYEKYRSHEVLKAFVGKLIVLNTTSPSTNDYGRMPLETTSGNCGFLDEEKLCSIQRNLGAEMLSVTCATYPRAIQPDPMQVGGAEAALNLSCPEAARLVLLDPGLLSATPWPLRLPRAYASVWQEDGTHFGLGEARLAVRDFVLTVLSDRRYPVWQRLYLLGPLVRRLKTLAGPSALAAWCEANPAMVAHVLGDSARTAAGMRLKPTMDDLEAQPAEQLQLVMEILRMRLAEPPTGVRFIECIQEFELGLKTATARTEQEILEAFATGRRFYDALLEEHPQLIENYLVNHVFKNSFPFGRTSLRASAMPAATVDPEDEHTYLCVLATLAQTLLIGMAAHYREEFGVAHCVKLVQSLARAIEHGTTFPARLAEYVQQRGPDAILIRPVSAPVVPVERPVSSIPVPRRPQPTPAYLPQTFPSPSVPARIAP